MVSEQAGSRHYGIAALKRSFVHFVLGKGVVASSAFIVLLLIIRKLSVAEFAVYTSLHATVRIIGLVSSCGVNSVLHRYLPELRTHDNNRAMYKLLVYIIALRALLYAVLALALLFFVDYLSSAFKLGDWSWLLPWYFLVGFLRINATFIVMALESLLWQREAQYSVAIGGLVKLVSVVGVVMLGDLTLGTFVAIECIAEFTSLGLLLASLALRWKRDEERDLGDSATIAKDRQRYIRFGLWSYMQNLTSILYGSAPNRLFVSYFLATEYIAIFGVVDRFIDFVQRYRPARLFVGLIRPVFMSRFSRDNNFNHLVAMANFLYRVDLMILVLPMVLFSVAGEPLFDWITAGKYAHVTPIFLGFYLVLLIHSLHIIMDILVKAIEHTRIYTFSNLVLSASIVIAIPLIPHINLWSIVVANISGLIASLMIIVAYIKKQGYTYAFDWALTSIVVSYALVSALIGQLMLWMDVPVSIAAVVTCLCYAGMIFVKAPVRKSEKALASKFLPAKFNRDKNGAA